MKFKISFPPGPDLTREEQWAWWASDELGFLDTCFQAFGDIFTLNLGDFSNNLNRSVAFNGKWVFLAHPEYMKFIFRHSGDKLHGGEANVVLFGNIARNRGIMRLDGQAHNDRRQLLLKVFKRSNLNLNTEAMRDCAGEVLQAWPNAASNRSLSMINEIQKMTIRVIIHTIFGITEKAWKEWLCKKLMMVENGKYTREQIRSVEKELSENIEVQINELEMMDREELKTRNDILAFLMRSRTEEKHDLNKERIRDELLSLLKAGFGTTAHAMTWVMECLFNNPDVLKEVNEEIETVVGNEPISKNHVDRLHYLEAVIMEGLRARSISGILGPRLVKSPLTIARGSGSTKYILPPGTMVVNCAHLLHHNPEVHKSPEKFDPQRFVVLTNPGEKKKKWRLNLDSDLKNRWTPFGGGRRRCLGENFAILEMKVVIWSILQYLKERQLEIHIPKLSKVEKQAFFLVPKDGLPFTLRKKRVKKPRKQDPAITIK